MSEMNRSRRASIALSLATAVLLLYGLAGVWLLGYAALLWLGGSQGWAFVVSTLAVGTWCCALAGICGSQRTNEEAS